MFITVNNPLARSSDSTKYVNKTVTVNRAPTDQSVKLLMEMEKAAEKKITDSIRINNNVIDFIVHKRFNLDVGNDEYKIIYDINGTRKVLDYIDWGLHGDNNQSKENLFNGIFTALSESIASTLLEKYEFNEGWI